MIESARLVLLVALLSGCATHGGAAPGPIAKRVASLVDATTRNGSEARAFTELESMGDSAVPYLIGHLGDARPLPVGQISLANRSPDAFEGVRHYSPKVVHDALSAILNQLTGRSFVFVYNGSDAAERETDRKQWQAWCIEAFPEKAAICRGAL